MSEKNFDFDPEFSEYNPILEEIASIKRGTTERENEGFMASLIKMLTNTRIVFSLEE